MKKVLLLISTFMLTGCFTKLTVKEDVDNTVEIPLQIEVENKNALSNEQRDVLDEINSNQKVDFNKLSNAFTNKYAQDSAQGLSGYQKIAKSLTQHMSLPEMKLMIDREIMKQSAASELEYHPTFSHPSQLLELGAGNNYAGTLLHQIVIRKLWNTKEWFESRFNVVLYTAGTVLPARMVRSQDKWVLHSIDTTVEGQGLINWGNPEDFLRYVHIIDANVFAAVMLYKDHLTNPVTVLNKAIAFTKKKYDLKERNDFLISKIAQADVAPEFDEVFGADPFAIPGHTRTKQGTREKVNKHVSLTYGGYMPYRPIKTDDESHDFISFGDEDFVNPLAGVEFPNVYFGTWTLEDPRDLSNQTKLKIIRTEEKEEKFLIGELYITLPQGETNEERDTEQIKVDIRIKYNKNKLMIRPFFGRTMEQLKAKSVINNLLMGDYFYLVMKEDNELKDKMLRTWTWTTN